MAPPTHPALARVPSVAIPAAVPVVPAESKHKKGKQHHKGHRPGLTLYQGHMARLTLTSKTGASEGYMLSSATCPHGSCELDGNRLTYTAPMDYVGLVEVKCIGQETHGLQEEHTLLVDVLKVPGGEASKLHPEPTPKCNPNYRYHDCDCDRDCGHQHGLPIIVMAVTQIKHTFALH